ncbi:MAG: response regulator, partial [Alphaproteobacteria bacterium]|nr:response regulator [Alphaproteobacteria bacterium]
WLVDQVADLLGTRAHDKGTQLLSYVDPEIPDHLVGDTVRIRQILTNLVGNAIKFTDYGSIGIDVTAEKMTENTVTLMFRVTDTGIGIDDEAQKRLFQPFIQADGSTTRRFGGSGLGLSISRALVQMMDGEIGVESALGRGATFWVRVPLGIQPELRATRRDQLTGKNALVVTENTALSRVVDRYLTFAGARVEAVETAARALDLMRESVTRGRTVDFVLIDDDLPFRAAEKLVALIADSGLSKVTRSVVMLARSSVAQAGERFPGSFALLPKPVSRQNLWDVAAGAAGIAPIDPVRSAVSRPGDNRILNVKYLPPDPEAARKNGTIILIAEDNRINQTVIRMMFERIGLVADIVENGTEALAALKEQEYGLLLTDCHMPEMDGYTLAAKIREMERETGRHLPVIAITADVLSGTEEMCRSTGMDACIKKPIGIADIEAVVRTFLPAALEQRQRISPPGITASPFAGTALESSAEPVLDLSCLRAVTGDDDTAVMEILNDFLRLTPSLIDEMDRALAANDVNGARDAAHSIKGSARMAGAMRLGEICAEIQSLLDLGNVEQATARAGLVRPALADIAAEM